MYTDFGSWLTDLESFKLGLTLGIFMGILLYFIIVAIIEYAVDLFIKKWGKKDENPLTSDDDKTNI